MPSDTTQELIERFAQERHALARLLAAQRLRPFLRLGLTVHQLKIVLLVATAVARTGKELAEILQVKPSTISASVEKLVELGYLDRSGTESDRRVKRLVATALAKRVYEQLLDKREASDDVLASLSRADLAALVQGTSALRQAIEARIGDDPLGESESADQSVNTAP